jgi:hypothetical protein
MENKNKDIKFGNEWREFRKRNGLILDTLLLVSVFLNLMESCNQLTEVFYIFLLVLGLKIKNL